MFITMPQLGETVTEGTIVRWCKAVGDTVAEDEPLFEVSTDKVDTEVPSAVAGVLSEILVAEGDTASVGARLAVVRTDGDSPSAEHERSRRSHRTPSRLRAAPERSPRRPQPRRRRGASAAIAPGRAGHPRRRRRPHRGAGAAAGVPGAASAAPVEPVSPGSRRCRSPAQATASSRSRRCGAPPAPTCAGRSPPPRTRSS